MRNIREWAELASGSVRTTPDKAHEIAVICYHDEQSGGAIGTWHASHLVHGNTHCNCYHCYKRVPA